jgi:DNA-binding LacI/PurR family transcriptional regulator
MNIALIARKARVSTATVSRTLNNSPLVREKTAARVRKVIAELGYIPNGSARSLSSGRTNLLGVIISDITNPFFPELISSFERLSAEQSYEVIVANTNYDPVRLEHALHRMMQRRVDGIALMTSEMHEPALAMLKKQKIPTVTLQHRIEGSDFNTVRVDHRIGIRKAVQHLVELGHSEIAFISGPASLWSANKRRDLVLAELARNKLKLAPSCLLEGNHRVDGGMAAMKILLALNDRPTAIVCSNDLTALGVLKTIHEAGLEVPRDFSLVGFDDIEMVSLMHPALTTVRIPRAEIAAEALTMLLAAIAGSTLKPRETTVETKLIIRQSTAAPRLRHKKTVQKSEA